VVEAAAMAHAESSPVLRVLVAVGLEAQERVALQQALVAVAAAAALAGIRVAPALPER
jgi:hypothetical protein